MEKGKEGEKIERERGKEESRHYAERARQRNVRPRHPFITVFLN